MNRDDIEIKSVEFADGGIHVSYFVPTNVRVGGAVFKSETLSLSTKHPDYADDIDGLHRKVVKVLLNAMEDWDVSEPYVPDDDDEDDDEKGMGE